MCRHLYDKLKTINQQAEIIIIIQFGKWIHNSQHLHRELIEYQCFGCRICLAAWLHYLPPLCACVCACVCVCVCVRLCYLCVLRWYLRWAGQVNVLQQPSNEQRRICLERGRPVRGGSSRLSPSAVRPCVWSPRQPGEESERGRAEKQSRRARWPASGAPAVQKPITGFWLRPAERARPKENNPEAECNHFLLLPLWLFECL